MENSLDLLEVLQHIDPSRLDYTSWLSVGMALKDEGYSVTDFDDCSRRDSHRYHVSANGVVSLGLLHRLPAGQLSSSLRNKAGTAPLYPVQMKDTLSNGTM